LGKIFKRSAISITDDFFLDLDGHSLLAAMVVSELRRNEAFSHISVGDIYNAPTVEKLSCELEKKKYSDKKFRKKPIIFGLYPVRLIHFVRSARLLAYYFYAG